MSIKMGRAAGQKELIDTGQYWVTYRGKFAGYYERHEGMPVFIVRRPKLLTEEQMGELAHLVRAIDERENYNSPREIVFTKGIDPLPDRTETPAKSRIILPGE